MLIRYMFLAAALLPSALPCRATSLDAASRHVRDGRYVSARRCLLEMPDGPPRRSLLERLERHVAAERARDDLSFVERCYLEGYEAWRREDADAARRSWARYLGVRRVQGDEGADERWREVASLWNESRPRPVELEVSASTKAVNVERAPAPRRRARPKRKYHVRPVRRNPVRTSSAGAAAVDVKPFLVSARTAHRSGQLEEALRFYRLVQRIDPGSGEARKGIEEIEKETR